MGKVETTKKRTSKSKRRLKRQIRKTLAAIFMITAIVVAAIPVDNLKAEEQSPAGGGQAQASALGTTSTVAYQYPTDVTFIDQPRVILNYEKAKQAAATAGKTFEEGATYYMIYDSANNVYQMQWRYKYYVAELDGNSYGIIYKYNNISPVDSLTVTSKETVNYLKIDGDEFNQFKEAKRSDAGQIVYNFTCADYVSLLDNPNSRMIKKYRTTQWNEFVTECENWKKDEKDPKRADAPRISLSTKDLSDDEFLTYYCEITEAEFGHVKAKLTGCTLDVVYDLTRKTDDGKYKQIYVVKAVGQTATGVTYETDTHYVYNETVSIVGIGEDTFKDIQNVQGYTIETGIAYIGDYSFSGSSAKEITFLSGVQYIGNRSFKNCQLLSKVSFSDDNINIGTEAFYGCAISSLTLPKLVKKIGVGAFASCSNLTEVDFTGVNYYDSANQVGCEIEEAAFYNDYAINELKFFSGNNSCTITKLGKACFAVDHSVSSALTEIALPSSINSSAGLGGYLFYNRNNLKKLTMPSEYGFHTSQTIPDDFLAGVKNLEELIFLENSANIDYATDNKGTSQGGGTPVNTALFRDITAENFVVRGPARDEAYNVAKVRTTTWKAAFNNANETPIPYVYKDAEGNDVYEIATGENNAYIMSVNKEGELTGCQINTNSGLNSDAIVDFTIPSKVGDYTITSIASGCFEKFKNNIKSLTINDDSVEILEANAFENCPNLEVVYLGDSITQVGARAFANCPKLENVYFRTPDCGYEAFEIGTSAFATGGSQLTFHGDIDEKYDAFEYAMASANWVDESINTNQISICYKSDYVKNDKPTFLTVLKERYKTSEGTIGTRATLVDYLHYEELAALPESLLGDTYQITDSWKDIMYNYEAGNGVTPKEEEIINAAINIVIPSGIESIDVNTFLNSGLNTGNIATYLHMTLGYQDTDPTKSNYYANYAYTTKPDFANEGITKYNILNRDGLSKIDEPDSSGVAAAGTHVKITPKSNTISSFETIGGNSYDEWEIAGWIVYTKDPNFVISGNDTYHPTILEFNMPKCDVDVKTIYSPIVAMTADNSTGSTLEINKSAPGTLRTDVNGYLYTFDSWELSLYVSSNGIANQQAGGDWRNYVKAPDGSALNLKSNPLIFTLEDGYMVQLKAHYAAANLGVVYTSFNHSLLTNYAAAPRRSTTVVNFDYYYNYSDYGLFNGYYGYENSTDKYLYSAREYDATKDKASLELVDIGNDFIKSVSMSTVKELPDYCFNSCEQLENINLGENIEHIGSAAFTGCEKLTGLSSSGKYISQNGILYYTNDDGTYELVECLTSRGHGVGSTQYPDKDDIDISKVSKIANGAFEGCKYLRDVDLSTATQMTTIPENTFKDCTSLQKVLLPRTITTIETGAFENTDNAYVTIPTAVLEIQDNAFSKGETIRSYQNGSGYYYTQKFKDVYFEAIDVSYTVDFLDWDGTKLCDTQYVEPGKNATPPADPKREGYTFKGWNGTYLGVEKDSLVVAIYEPIKEETPVTPTYKLDVEMGTGDGSYAAGTKVVITAQEPFDGYEFDKWTSDKSDYNIVDASAYLTTITMPAHDLEIKATYKKKSADGTGANANNSSTNGTVSGNNASNSSTKPGSSGSGSGSVSGNNGGSGSGSNGGNGGNGGTKVDVDKTGISNSSISSAIVNGTTDNFIVKITDSSAATEAVRQALINEYGSLENIAYMAMDISLYDSTGTTKITDTKGISVTITIPIPDSLIQYSGNNKAAGVVDSLNGYALDKLGAKFSTIDGVSCITFTATHFSPYTIYVDKSNLSYSSTLDDSPTTGDGIHPKWFLSIGLAALSVFLFFKKDRKPMKKARLA